jgi:diguanylate cyclase (GGDEF)-like protein
VAGPIIEEEKAMGTYVISLRAAWRLGGALLIVIAVTTLATALLLSVEIDGWIIALTGIAAVTGLSFQRIPPEQLDVRWLIAVPVLAVVEVALAVALVDFVLTVLFLPVALYVALLLPSPRFAVPFLVLMTAALLAPFIYSDQPSRDTALWLLVVGPTAIFVTIVTGRLTAGLHTSREAYRRLSIVDGLTGVGNYRALMTRLHHETGRHARKNREFAVLTLDLDSFKEINETSGHLVGDALLAIVGSILDMKVRTEDGVYRQGGDEFSVVAPETGRDEATLLGRRIERALRGIRSGGVRVSASIGMAIYPHDGSDPAELLDAADLDLRTRKGEPREFSRFV